MSEPQPSTTDRARQTLVEQLAAALRLLTNRLAAQQSNMVDVRGLSVMAEDIAQRARTLGSGSGRGNEAALRQLYADLEVFQAQFVQLTGRVTVEASNTENIIRLLTAHAGALSQLCGAASSPGGMADLRVQLRGLLSGLEGAAVVPHAGQQLSSELAALAGRAPGLASRAETLVEGEMRNIRESLIGLSRDLRDFAEAAVQMADRMAEDARASGSAAELLMSTTLGLAQAQRTAPAPEVALASVVEQGRQALEGTRRAWGT